MFLCLLNTCESRYFSLVCMLQQKIVPCSHKAWDKQPKAITEILIWQAGGRTQSSYYRNFRDLKAIIFKVHCKGMGREGRKAFRGPSVGVQVLHASAHTVPYREHSRRFYPDDSFLHLPRVCAKLTFQVTFPSPNAKSALPPQLSELTFVRFSQNH